MKNRYQKIVALVIALKNLFPHIKTIHDPTIKIESDIFIKNDISLLYDMLVHCLTVINRLYRNKDKEGNYISKREDYATALMLISPLFAAETMKISENVREYYQLLVDEISFTTPFTWRDLQALTGKKKTSCNRIIQELIQLKLIRKAGRGHRGLYLYELIPQDPVEETSYIWESAIEEWKDTKVYEPF